MTNLSSERPTLQREKKLWGCALQRTRLRSLGLALKIWHDVATHNHQNPHKAFFHVEIFLCYKEILMGRRDSLLISDLFQNCT